MQVYEDFTYVAQSHTNHLGVCGSGSGGGGGYRGAGEHKRDGAKGPVRSAES